MNKKLTAIILVGALACAMTVPAMAEGNTAVPISAPISVEEPQPLPDSVLYYGTVKEWVKDENGAIKQLVLESERYGAYVMNISEDTVWIDSGRRTQSDPSDLKQGERVYVFHSAVETRSLPPQTTAFAVVRNIPMDAGSAMYHKVESVSLQDGKLTITTDNGGLLMFADSETQLLSYGTDAAPSLEDIQPGSHVMAWYGAVAASYPGQAHANALMVLPKQETAENSEKGSLLTRAGLVSALHEKTGKPVVNYAIHYTDVNADSGYMEAVRWAVSEGLLKEEGESFLPDNFVNREELAVALWRYAGSPMPESYAVLNEIADADEISVSARPAVAWVCETGALSVMEEDIFAPQQPATTGILHSALEKLS